MILPDPAHRISHAAVWHWAVRYGLFVLLGVAVIGTPTVLIPMPGSAKFIVLSIEVGVAAVAAALAVGVPIWRYAVHRWEVTDTFIVTRSGAIFRDWRIVPLHRVQTVEVSQGVLERAFGVARLVIRTASYAGSTEVAGMDAKVAREVADGLTVALAGHVRSGHGDDGA